MLIYSLFQTITLVAMVKLHVKRGEESQFLFSTTVDISIETLTQQVTQIYDGRLKVDRICSGNCFMQDVEISKQLYINVFYKHYSYCWLL